MSEWISLKQEEPKIGTRVLVYVVDYEEDYEFQIVAQLHQSGWSNLIRGQSATHWMPLPAPPDTKGTP